MHQSTYAVTINHDCMIAMGALKVQLWYFVYRIEHLCGQCRNTTACMSRRKKKRIILIQKSSNTITCSFKSTHTLRYFWNPSCSVERYRLECWNIFFHFFGFSVPMLNKIVNKASYAQL